MPVVNPEDADDGRRLPWRPTTFRRFEEALDTSMGTARIITDAGPAYIKSLGNREGPHPLACELVATRLADWFGLPIFEFAIIQLDAEIDEIPYLDGGYAASGPAFVTKSTLGHTWGGSESELSNLVNPGDVGRLVVFDTWVQNCDRYLPDLRSVRANYDNVFLEDFVGENAGKLRLVAMDHTHCFTCGREIDRKISNIDRIKDERIYGVFPGFRKLVRKADVESAIDRLREVDVQVVQPIVEDIPEEWEVNKNSRKALIELIVRRAEFVSETVMKSIRRECWRDQLFDNG